VAVRPGDRCGAARRRLPRHPRLLATLGPERQERAARAARPSHRACARRRR